MKALRIAGFLVAFGVSLVATATAQAAPRIFRGCAAWTFPFCFMLTTTDKKTYQLLDAGPAFPPGRRVLVYANKVGDVGLCFAPTLKVVRFKDLGPC
jgi:hypothetical protein